MAHGLPVVLSAEQYCGFAGFVRHQHDAWVLQDPRDAKQLVEAIYALGESPQLREKFVRQSEALVEFFSWETVAQRYEAVYARALTQKKAFHSQPRTQ
jgi:UDP-glucose:(heptosyl)LPS alpha-1,3-glucosyltransferase